jgi:hypothetical protein
MQCASAAAISAYSTEASSCGVLKRSISASCSLSRRILILENRRSLADRLALRVERLDHQVRIPCDGKPAGWIAFEPFGRGLQAQVLFALRVDRHLRRAVARACTVESCI